MKTFISIDIPEGIKEEIIKIQDKLPEFKGKKTEPENLHLTLKFLGEINNKKVEKVKARLRRIDYNSFAAEIGPLGYFDNQRSRKYSQNLVTWLHLTNCGGLQKVIDEDMGDLFAREERFMSHLTIARVKKVKNKKLFLEKLKQIKVPNLKFKVDAFYLMESKLSEKGPEYSVIERYSLE